MVVIAKQKNTRVSVYLMNFAYFFLGNGHTRDLLLELRNSGKIPFNKNCVSERVRTRVPIYSLFRRAMYLFARAS